jgi:hypothetical protein
MTLPPAPDRWTIELSNAERMEAVAAFGFTERQARFLLNVLLHSGVFVERQYCAFAGIVHGQKSTDFIKTLVDRRFATPITTGKLHRGRMYHLHYKPLWAAIGEPDNRFRKPTAQGRMIERVMLLDAVLDDREFTWLGPSMDKRRHFIRHLGDRLELRDYPHLLFGDGPEKTVRYFPDKLPIGMQPHADTHVFVYLVTRPSRLIPSRDSCDSQDARCCRIRVTRRSSRTPSAAAMLHMWTRGLARGLHRERLRPREAADRRGCRSSSQAPKAAARRAQTDRGAQEEALSMTGFQVSSDQSEN